MFGFYGCYNNPYRNAFAFTSGFMNGFYSAYWRQTACYDYPPPRCRYDYYYSPGYYDYSGYSIFPGNYYCAQPRSYYYDGYSDYSSYYGDYYSYSGNYSYDRYSSYYGNPSYSYYSSSSGSYSRYSNNRGNTNPVTSSRNGTERPPAARTLGKEFLDAVKGVAERINCDYRDLLAVMNAESGLDPTEVNKKSGATGLIQFMPKTAAGYGLTTAQIKNMSAMEQLPYVERYLRNSKEDLAGFDPDAQLTGADLYAIVFLPGRAKREVLCVRGASKDDNRYYNGNKPVDLNKDGKITKSELQQRIETFRVDESIFQ